MANGNMTINKALKEDLAVEVKMDLYLLDDGRVLKYDRYSHGNAVWVDESGREYRNFHEAYYKF